MIEDTSEASVETAVSTAIAHIRQAMINPYIESAVEQGKMSEEYLLGLGRNVDLFGKIMGGK